MVSFEEAFEPSMLGIKGGNLTTAKVSYQQIIAEFSEIVGSQDYCPRRVEPAAGPHAHAYMSICVERINQSQAGTLHFIFFVLVLFGEGHEEISIDILHIEWGKVGGQSRVGKGPRGQRHWTKVSVENVHCASMKI